MRAQLIQPATANSRSWAGVAALGIALLTALTLPGASRTVGDYPGLQPMFATFGVVTQLITAYLLFVQHRVTHDIWFAALAGTYLYAALMVAAHLLSFPGIFGAEAPFGATRQTTVWLWTLWHGGYPALALIALLLRSPRMEPHVAARPVAIGIALLVVPPLLALLLIRLAFVPPGLLPALVDARPDATLTASPTATAVLLINGAALLGCLLITRLRDLLSLWLSVALLACLADTLLTLSGSVRFSVGWYSGRAQSVMAASILLAVLIWEIASLYRRLADSNRQLEERAIRDGLTGAYNRGYFEEQFPREFRRARREGRPLSLLMIDVDHFKQFNDSHGHLAGDRCLVALVEVLDGLIRRPGDYVARYGGEEFVMVLPNTDAAGALRVAQIVHDAVCQRALPRSDAQGPRVTISVGVATGLPQRNDGMEPTDLVDHADDALYRVKHEGRDGIRVHQSPDERLSARELVTP